jgi:hypothetical protein
MDEHLAQTLTTEWLGEQAVRTPVEAMNSTTWIVEAAGERYALKIARPTEAPGLKAAAWLHDRGVRTGAPIRTAIRDGIAASASAGVSSIREAPFNQELVDRTLYQRRPGSSWISAPGTRPKSRCNAHRLVSTARVAATLRSPSEVLLRRPRRRPG